MSEPKRVRLTLVKSPIGSQKRQKDTVKALGLPRVRSTRIVTMTPHMEGMVKKVAHLLDIEDVAEGVEE